MKTLIVGLMAASLSAGSWAASESAADYVESKKTAETRIASWSAAPVDLSQATSNSVQKSNGIIWHADKAQTPVEKRATQPQQSSRSHYFTLWDAGREMIRDDDDDGYYARFKIRFDADVSIGDALVYAKLYIRRVGDSGPWLRYYTTNDFWIYGTSGTDDYYVDTILTGGYPTGYYDVLIDLYEVGYDGIVATIGPAEDSSLRDLALEQEDFDRPLHYLGVHINDARTELLEDRDGDGYYSRFSVTVDPDMDNGTGEVYAIVYARAASGAWLEELRSDPFPVYVNSGADAYQFTAEWQQGYPTDHYDFRIELVDTLTGYVVASVGSEDPSLSRVPLEDQSRDQRPSPPPPGGGDSDSDSRGSGGGGSISYGLVLLLLALLWQRSTAVRTAAANPDVRLIPRK
ncbi:choice-of-anchor H family protein [Permianibacter aggregans]|uniref:Uncharacterized protein n=1 Tax=Permianibacter aggregans TaxID=1510150 RepID=A0A4R6UMZ2_9GAMM|nr:choice-of-anchor H family protein [Permianibacter aggregans]QGX41078.1 hypothetical protein E2H98_15955 [Permianibacter aggregans]TDQ48142.1 hypothetical protein EV696_108122 [Permianibacter aggregans]